VKFFFDANFPGGLARAVREVVVNRSIEIITHDLWFPDGTRDVKWIPDVASRDPKPFVIGGDGAILRRPSEAIALRESGLTYFLLSRTFPQLDIYEQASKFFKCLPNILAEAERIRTPTIFEITVNGKVESKFATANIPVGKASTGKQK
jgi:hypothetical protein